MISLSNTQTEVNRTATLAMALQQKIERQLEKEKMRIFDKIFHYPPPIPACDVQFNFLLEERASITQELRRLHEISEIESINFDFIESMREFVESSKYFDNVLSAKLVSELEIVMELCNQSTKPNQKL